MKKITVQIQDNSLVFKYRTNKPVAVNLLNTNVITDNELVFSDEYISQNKKIVGLFIKDLVLEKQINQIVISNNEMATLILSVTRGINSINKLTLKEEQPLSYDICERIIRYHNIKCVECYSVPTFMIDLLDKNDIDVISKSEVLFLSEFMDNNQLNSFSDIYYKKNIIFKNDISVDDVNDFNVFLNINKYLRIINIEKYSKENINAITDLLIDARRKNISIRIHDDVKNIDDIEYLREYNKELKKKYRIDLSLVYSKNYLAENYVKQLTFTTLKICSIIVFFIILGIIGGITLDSSMSMKKDTKIRNEIMEIKELDNSDDPTDTIEEPLVDAYGTTIVNYGKLLEVNPDTIGWLTVKGTNIDYPVVKTTDNNYYLKRNYYFESDSNGWVFMDYRNDNKNLDQNTIIYAHNRYYSGVMFGTLNRVTKWNWYSNEDNLYITFNTLYENLQWKIFSIYSIDVTTDYLNTNFNSKEEYQEFLNMIKGRSDAYLTTKVTTDDKILTLSTCLDNNRRLVVHAVLVNNGTES